MPVSCWGEKSICELLNIVSFYTLSFHVCLDLVIDYQGTYCNYMEHTYNCTVLVTSIHCMGSNWRSLSFILLSFRHLSFSPLNLLAGLHFSLSAFLKLSRSFKFWIFYLFSLGVLNSLLTVRSPVSLSIRPPVRLSTCQQSYNYNSKKNVIFSTDFVKM